MKIHHVRVDEVKFPDVLLTTLASDNRIVFSDQVEYTWEYDEQQYIRFTDGGYAQFDLGCTVSVLRTDFVSEPNAIAEEGCW